MVISFKSISFGRIDKSIICIYNYTVPCWHSKVSLYCLRGTDALGASKRAREVSTGHFTILSFREGSLLLRIINL